MDSESVEYSKIFYGISAFLGVLAVLYFGFEYIQSLSPFTIAAILFGVFVSTLIIGINRDNWGIKLFTFLISGGSYLVFLSYVNGRFLETSNQTLASLVLSAILFSIIGYIMTDRREYLPDKEDAKKIVIVVAGLLALLVAYDIAFVGVEYNASFEEQVSLVEGENVIGELESVKTGYLPADIETQRFSVCAGTENQTIRIGSVRSSGYLTGFAPETSINELVLNMHERDFERLDEAGLESEFNVEEVDCSENVEEGVLGVDSADDIPYMIG